MAEEKKHALVSKTSKAPPDNVPDEISQIVQLTKTLAKEEANAKFDQNSDFRPPITLRRQFELLAGRGAPDALVFNADKHYAEYMDTIVAANKKSGMLADLDEKELRLFDFDSAMATRSWRDSVLHAKWLFAISGIITSAWKKVPATILRRVVDVAPSAGMSTVSIQRNFGEIPVAALPVTVEKRYDEALQDMLQDNLKSFTKNVTAYLPVPSLEHALMYCLAFANNVININLNWSTDLTSRTYRQILDFLDTRWEEVVSVTEWRKQRAEDHKGGDVMFPKGLQQYGGSIPPFVKAVLQNSDMGHIRLQTGTVVGMMMPYVMRANDPHDIRGDPHDPHDISPETNPTAFRDLLRVLKNGEAEHNYFHDDATTDFKLAASSHEFTAEDVEILKGRKQELQSVDVRKMGTVDLETEKGTPLRVTYVHHWDVLSVFITLCPRAPDVMARSETSDVVHQLMKNQQGLPIDEFRFKVDALFADLQPRGNWHGWLKYTGVVLKDNSGAPFKPIDKKKEMFSMITAESHPKTVKYWGAEIFLRQRQMQYALRVSEDAIAAAVQRFRADMIDLTAAVEAAKLRKNDVPTTSGSPLPTWKVLTRIASSAGVRYISDEKQRGPDYFQKLVDIVAFMRTWDIANLNRNSRLALYRYYSAAHTPKQAVLFAGLVDFRQKVWDPAIAGVRWEKNNLLPVGKPLRGNAFKQSGLVFTQEMILAIMAYEDTRLITAAIRVESPAQRQFILWDQSSAFLCDDSAIVAIENAIVLAITELDKRLAGGWTDSVLFQCVYCLLKIHRLMRTYLSLTIQKAYSWPSPHLMMILRREGDFVQHTELDYPADWVVIAKRTFEGGYRDMQPVELTAETSTAHRWSQATSRSIHELKSRGCTADSAVITAKFKLIGMDPVDFDKFHVPLTWWGAALAARELPYHLHMARAEVARALWNGMVGPSQQSGEDKMSIVDVDPVLGLSTYAASRVFPGEGSRITVILFAKPSSDKSSKVTLDTVTSTLQRCVHGVDIQWIKSRDEVRTTWCDIVPWKRHKGKGVRTIWQTLPAVGDKQNLLKQYLPQQVSDNQHFYDMTNAESKNKIDPIARILKHNWVRLNPDWSQDLTVHGLYTIATLITIAAMERYSIMFDFALPWQDQNRQRRQDKRGTILESLTHLIGVTFKQAGDAALTHIQDGRSAAPSVPLTLIRAELPSKYCFVFALVHWPAPRVDDVEVYELLRRSMQMQGFDVYTMRPVLGQTCNWKRVIEP